jgi:hypothetical protein
MVKVLAIGHARTGIRWEHIAPYVGEEARSVWELHESDRVREFYSYIGFRELFADPT